MICFRPCRSCASAGMPDCAEVKLMLSPGAERAGAAYPDRFIISFPLIFRKFLTSHANLGIIQS